MSEQQFPTEESKTGQTDHEQHRSPPGEGQDAPLAQHGADHAEFSVFDGSGNESVVAVTANEEGKVSEGTGPSASDALDDARDKKLGTDFSPGTPTEQGGNA